MEFGSRQDKTNGNYKGHTGWGLRMIDIKYFIKALKISWLKDNSKLAWFVLVFSVYDQFPEDVLVWTWVCRSAKGQYS